LSRRGISASINASRLYNPFPVRILFHTTGAMKIPRYLSQLAVVMLLVPTICGADVAARELVILGWAEPVYLPDPGFGLQAKLDSGAETSSLDARIIKKFRQHGKRWVRFGLSDPDSGEESVLVRERIRTIGVVQHDGSNQVRPTVMMQVCIADRLLDVEVSLVDRSEFSYSLLLGRRALASFALIDPGNTFLTDPQCKITAPDPDQPE
jgi:hypothetical protein